MSIYYQRINMRPLRKAGTEAGGWILGDETGFLVKNVRDTQQHVKAEQGKSGPSPDHEAAFPSQGTGDVLLAAPGDQESLVALPFSENNGGMGIETVGSAPRGGCGFAEKLDGRC
jgi:hypothetical protein